MRLALASSSPARLMLLRQAGIEPEVHPTDVDEDALIDAALAEHGSLAPEAYVGLLANAKAAAFVSTDAAGGFTGLVLGGDSALQLGDEMLGKPLTPERAHQRWLAQRGQTAVLHSGHCLIRLEEGRQVGSASTATATELTFSADIDEAEIAAYVATGEPLQVAGAFTIDGRGAAFIDTITGDPSTVIGMSVPAVRRLARELGVAWHDLWNL